MINNIFITCFLLTWYSSAAIIEQDASIILTLNKTLTTLNKELYGDFFNLTPSSTLKINLEINNKNVSFIIFQVHSHIHNLTVYNNTLVYGSSISGTNVGLYSVAQPVTDTFFIKNTNDISVQAYISIHGYRDSDPIPGGCNMEFVIPTSPFLHINNSNKGYIYIDAALAKYSKMECDKIGKDQQIFFYQMYLPENNFNEDVYFESLKKMLTLDSIRANGNQVPQTTPALTRRMMSSYPGTGAVYAVVAATPTGYSVYVPAVTYSCSLLEENGCALLDNALSEILCASLLFVGLFVCFVGHRFFKTAIFLVGALAGYVITYILMSLMVDLDSTALVGACVLSSMFFGAIWLTFWWFYGSPMFVILLSSLNVGFLCASIIYYKLPGRLIILEEDLNFWIIFIILMLLTSLLILLITILSNVLCCAILGAYAALFPIDYYIGSNLKYIIINTVRRAVVPKFNKAVLMPPCQYRDVIITSLWVLLATSGVIFQHWHNRGRPPFPPPPRSIGPAGSEEFIHGFQGQRARRYGATRNGYNNLPTASNTVVARRDLLNENTPLLQEA